MLAMQQISRRNWCRGAFLALCAAPTLAVTIWILARALLGAGLPGKEAWERELTARLGVRCRIGEVTYSSAGTTEIQQLELSDPETGLPLVRVQAAQVAKIDGGYSVTATDSEIDAGQLARLCKILHERLLCQGSGPERCEFSAE